MTQAQSKVTMTLNEIREYGPCSEGWTKLLKELGKTKADDTSVSLAFILKNNGIHNAIWCMRVNWFEHKELYMEFVKQCVERTEKYAAAAAAHAADADAAYAAAATAAAAAYAAAAADAYDAAYAATHEAAAGAAYDAAYDAAYAADAAACAAAAAAAYAAYAYAAATAERTLQYNHLMELLTK